VNECSQAFYGRVQFSLGERIVKKKAALCVVAVLGVLGVMLNGSKAWG